MTRNEAIERAKKIWPGKRPSVSPSIGGNNQPGVVQWWVDVQLAMFGEVVYG